MIGTETDEDLETIIRAFIPDEELQNIFLEELVKNRR
jgi:hypothetical protein